MVRAPFESSVPTAARNAAKPWRRKTPSTRAKPRSVRFRRLPGGAAARTAAPQVLHEPPGDAARDEGELGAQGAELAVALGERLALARDLSREGVDPLVLVCQLPCLEEGIPLDRRDGRHVVRATRARVEQSDGQLRVLLGEALQLAGRRGHPSAELLPVNPDLVHRLVEAGRRQPGRSSAYAPSPTRAIRLATLGS